MARRGFLMEGEGPNADTPIHAQEELTTEEGPGTMTCAGNGGGGSRILEMAAAAWSVPFRVGGVRVGKLEKGEDKMAGLAMLPVPSWGINEGEATGYMGISRQVREESGTARPVLSWEGDGGDWEMPGRR